MPLPLADPRPAGGRLRLLSPASPWLLSNSFANVEKIAARIGPATIALHPADAAERGLAEGDEALVANETGSLPLRVTLSEALAAWGGAVPQGPLAQARARAGECERAESRPEVGYGGKHLCARRRSRGHTAGTVVRTAIHTPWRLAR